MNDTARFSNPRFSLPILLVLYLIFFWSDWATHSPGMDSMTYGAIARHMLETGDYLVPHYNEQAYVNFFQHPPLGLWMMAFSMKAIRAFFGENAYHSDLVLKVLPSLFGGFCVWLTYHWGKRLRGENFAFVAALVLLTSTRFVKFSKGFMLDPFLATFSFVAVYLAFRRPRICPFLSGLSVAAAFLSKGLFAFAPFAVILLVYARNWKKMGFFLLGATLPMLAWFAFGDAANYLHHYYLEHVAERVGPHPFRDHLEPFANLLRVYWPWLPFFLSGIFYIVKKYHPFRFGRGWFGLFQNEEFAIGLASLSFLGGFALVASFLEQYHTAFYPFAALVVAIGFPEKWFQKVPKLERPLLVLVVLAALFFAAFPYQMRSQEYASPLRILFREIRPACGTHPKRITVSTNVAEIWYALAIGSWYTDYAVRSDPATKEPRETNSDLLVALTNESKSPNWETTSLRSGPYSLYRRKGSSFCLDL